MKLIIENKEVEIKPDNPEDVIKRCFGINARIAQPSERYTYTMYREGKGGEPDELIHDGTELHEGDAIYFIPPAYGA